MIKEDFNSSFQAWCKWSDDVYEIDVPSITIYRGGMRIPVSEDSCKWFIQPNNSKKMCDVNYEFGGFGAAMRLALIMFQEEFK